jgi:hypothetical protein
MARHENVSETPANTPDTARGNILATDFFNADRSTAGSTSALPEHMDNPEGLSHF